MASNKVEIIRRMIGELTPEETETCAVMFLAELSDEDFINAVTQQCGADDVLKDELVSSLED